MARRNPFTVALAGLTIAVAVALAPPLVASAKEPGASSHEKTSTEAPREAAASRLPAPKETAHKIPIPGGRLAFTATAGSLPITNKAGDVLAEIAYVAYVANGREAAARPVAFAFNGGPGAASAWLHLGAMGPWRTPLVPMPDCDTTTCSNDRKQPLLVDNRETWLSFTDLVFIDPVGTGYSRLITKPGPAAEAGSKGGRRWRRQWERLRERGGPDYFHSVIGDADSLARFIAQWIQANHRENSRKIIVGESYGGFRAPKIAYLLEDNHDIRLDAMVLVSPVLDFESRRGMFAPLHYVNLLPSLVATAMERQGRPVSRLALAETEAYARSEFVVDLIRGARDAGAVERIADRLSNLTGLAKQTLQRSGGRLTARSFLTELDSASQRYASIYDASVTRLQEKSSRNSRYYSDPFTGDVSPRLVQAMGELYAGKLGWRPEGAYELQNSTVNHNWRWPNSPNAAHSVEELMEVMARNGTMKLLVTHGFTDLVTPYFASELLLDQISTRASWRRVKRAVYPGGHMFYSRDPSRAEFTSDVRNLVLPDPASGDHGTEAP
ncbi:MAG: hypothetical protein RLZ98_657 [Pseudomonadota bacterium]